MEYQEIEGRLSEKVFYYFKKLSEIPRGSGNTKAVSDYCVAFARERGLSCRQDGANNVVIEKEAAPGYENAPVVMIQGHLDMVCAKETNVAHDFEREGIRLASEGDFIYADGTTLGGDDGIAVAYGLALLDSEGIPHPALECVFTSDEEIGMVGAGKLDMSGFKARYLLNLDSEGEGVFLAGCAGGIRYDVRIPVTREEARGVLCEISLDRLLGGHSGADIHRGRANANLLAGRILDELISVKKFKLCQIRGGSQDNVIPGAAGIQLMTDEAGAEAFSEKAESLEKIFRKEYHVTDPQITLDFKILGRKERNVLTAESTVSVIRFLLNSPNGIQAMSQELPGLVETSLNLGILSLEERELRASYLLRSSLGTGKRALMRRLEAYVELFGGSFETSGDYPEWELVSASPLLTLLCRVYEEQYGKKASVETIHAGVECGLFAAGIPGLMAVSMGPDMFDIHTPGERLSISSAERVWNFLLEVLRRMNEA